MKKYLLSILLACSSTSCNAAVMSLSNNYNDNNFEQTTTLNLPTWNNSLGVIQSVNISYLGTLTSTVYFSQAYNQPLMGTFSNSMLVYPQKQYVALYAHEADQIAPQLVTESIPVNFSTDLPIDQTDFTLAFSTLISIAGAKPESDLMRLNGVLTTTYNYDPVAVSEPYTLPILLVTLVFVFWLKENFNTL